MKKPWQWCGSVLTACPHNCLTCAWDSEKKKLSCTLCADGYQKTTNPTCDCTFCIQQHYRPRMRLVMRSFVLSVCLRVCPVCVPTFQSFIFDVRVHVQNIYVKFVCQSHRVKVKVEGNYIHTFACGPPSIERQCC